jgi:kumamolisin
MSTTSSDSILVDFPASLNLEQIQVLPNYTSITQPPLLTAPQIATAYIIPPSTGSGVKVGIISLGGGFSQTDLNMSMSNLGLTTGNVTFVGVDGATNTYETNPANVAAYSGTVENTLDLVCVAGMVPSANIVLYKGQSSGTSYNIDPNVAANTNKTKSFANTVQRAVDDNCDVISISWGVSEKAISANVTYYCGDWLAGPLANAVAKGISVFVASGDYGSQAVDSPDPAFQIVSADYPSTNANLVAVGGTYLSLTGSNTRSGNETVYNIGGVGGGGGISSFVSRPSWQANLTYKTYPGNVVSTLTTRGIPDISAPMNGYGLWLNGTVLSIGGTSASAPIMAGMVARFISLNGGRRPIQPLNKLFYNNLSSFYDIATGNNASLLPTGYAATTGWDAVTGWGSQANATQTYQSVTSGGLKVKNSSGTWTPVKNVQYKNPQTGQWGNVRAIWTKVNSTTWTQVF